MKTLMLDPIEKVSKTIPYGVCVYQQSRALYQIGLALHAASLCFEHITDGTFPLQYKVSVFTFILSEKPGLNIANILILIVLLSHLKVMKALFS